MRLSVLLHYLGLPLRVAPLILIMIFALVLAVAENAGVFGVFALAIVGSWFFKYAFAVLDNVLDGRPEPPVLSSEMVDPLQQRPLGTLLLVAFFYFLTDLLQPRFGAEVVIVLRLVLLAVVPAMIAAMCVNGQFMDALNPIAVFGIISRIPAAYAKLLLGIVAIWLGPLLLLQESSDSLAALWRVESFLPGQILATIGVRGALTGMLGQILFMYLWLTTFACIGGTIYEHRFELGFEFTGTPERKAARASADLERQRDKIWDHIFAQVRNGALVNARESVRKLIAESKQPVEEYRWLYGRASVWADQRLANYLAQLTLPHLLDGRATGEALRMVRERLAINEDFRPRTSGQVLQLVRLARDAGDRNTARRLLVDFDRHYAKDELGPVAAQLQAELKP